MSESPRRLKFVRRAAAAVMGIVALAALVVGPVMAPPQASAQETGLETLGELPLSPTCTSDPGSVTTVPIAVDVQSRLLYIMFKCGGDKFGVYDISTEIPRFVRESPPIESSVRTWNSNTVQIDHDRGRIYVLGLSPLTEDGENTQIEVLDLTTLERVDTWSMTETVPGFAAFGFTHDAERDRIYLMGTFEGSDKARLAQSLALGPGMVPRTAVVAIDAGSGDRIWINPLRGCDAPLRTGKQGSLITMSARRPMLYGFCVGAAPAGVVPAGQGGLIRLDVSEQDGATGVTDFKSEFFPVSGTYSTSDLDLDGGGVVGLEPERERFVAQSLSDRTHGSWVFDGLRSSWIGFVAAPDNTNTFYGLDSVSGKYYMGGRSGWVNITDVGATPVPQGRLFDDIRSSTPWARDVEDSLGIASNLVVDPPTGRLFVHYLEGPRGALVLRDSTPSIIPRTPLDLDELTHDLPDDDARLEYSANTSGFGAQYVKVGGWENVWSRLPTIAGAENPANIRYGNRGATMSLVEQVGIASSGSSATAIALEPDDNTPADAGTKQNQVANQVNEATEPVGGLPSGDDEEPSGDGEDGEATEYATCLDGVGEPVTDEKGAKEEPAHAVVVCDLAELKTTGHARFSGGSGGGGVLVTNSSFDGETYRDPDRGIVTETEAIADGILFGEANVGGFSIDRVTSTATTWAKGLDGKSHVRWVRTVEGMRTIGADGSRGEPTSCTTIVESGKEVVEEGQCESLQKDLNELMPNRFEVKFPLPEIVATPGGAFASVQENESDFLSGQATNNDQRRAVPGMEMTIFADGPQRGRLWVQLAGVKADATFIRSPIQDFEPFGTSTAGADMETGDEGGGTTAPPTTGDEGGGAVDVPESTGTSAPPVTPEEPDVADDEHTMTIASHQERLVGGFGWLPALRSFGDAVLTGALYLVFLLPIAEIVRRRRLLDVLSDAGPADESSPSAGRSPARVAGPPVGVSGSPVGSTS